MPLNLKDRLKKMTAAESEPLLSSDELDDLLLQFRKTDANGKTPDETGWIPTYRLNAAAAEGWRWKAAKASELVSVDLDGERMSSNQIFEHCERMARMYSRRGAFSLTTG